MVMRLENGVVWGENGYGNFILAKAPKYPLLLNFGHSFLKNHSKCMKPGLPIFFDARISNIYVSREISLSKGNCMRIFNEFNKALYRLLGFIPEDISQSAF